MDKALLELLKEAKEKEEKKMNRSQEQKTEDRQQIFNVGFQAGIQYMMDKIERQYQLGKPILANDHLYWLKGEIEICMTLWMILKLNTMQKWEKTNKNVIVHYIEYKENT